VKLTLAAIRAFGPLLRLLSTEGHRAPELKNAIMANLHDRGALGDWTKDPDRLVTIAALSGFENFVHLLAGDIDEDAFLDVLARRLATGKPPGVDDKSYRRLRSRRTAT
jgi:hypothetical protein